MEPKLIEDDIEACKQGYEGSEPGTELEAMWMHNLLLAKMVQQQTRIADHLDEVTTAIDGLRLMTAIQG